VSELYEAIETGMGAHDEPLSNIISTQAPADADLMSKLIDYAKTGEDPHTVLSLYSAPMEDDPFSEATLKACNPAWGDFLNASEVLRTMKNAKAMPSREAEYRNLHLNQRVEASSPFISRAVWQGCGDPVLPLDDGAVVYGGLDLSAVSDLTALVLVSPVDSNGATVWQVHPTFWLPGTGLREKSNLDRVPYDIWAREGHLETTPGPTIEYEYVAAHLKKVFDRYDVRKMAFDRWQFDYLKPWLLQAGMPSEYLDADEGLFERFGQGFKSMSPALRDLESVILNKRLAHGGQPVLSMCAANATVQMDPAGNRKLTKMHRDRRIDGMVALAMAMSVAGTWQQADDDQSYLETGSLVFV
jgi:phage terminase large subunit-like protein